MSRRSALRLRLLLASLAAITALAALAAGAAARSIYVTNFGFLSPEAPLPGSLSIIDSRTNEAVPPFEFGTHPAAIAITPDGRTAYLANDNPASVSAVQVPSNRAIGEPLPVGEGLTDIAISPDGRRVYATDFTQDSVFVIDTRTNQLVGDPIEVGDGPESVAFTPDGARAYVTNAESKDVSVIDTGLGRVTAAIPVGRRPEGIAVTPDGSTVYVANDNDGTVSVIDTRTNTAVGSPIEVGNGPGSVAVSADGRAVYVSNFGDDSVSVIDARANEVLTTVQAGEEPLGIAVSPDSRTWYLATLGDQMVTGYDSATEQPLGPPIKVGFEPGRLAFVPDQPPTASFSGPGLVRPEVPVVLDASASRDPDGSIAAFAWDFGDGAAAPNGGPAPSHVFSRPGNYDITLALTDDEGCSTAFVFTGQTASCNGFGVATATRAVTVAYPGVGVRCPARARRLGCLFKLRAITKRRKGKTESALARVKLRAARSAIVTLRPTAAFASRFSPGSRVLVRKTSRIGTARRTTFSRLEIVR